MSTERLLTRPKGAWFPYEIEKPHKEADLTLEDYHKALIDKLNPPQFPNLSIDFMFCIRYNNVITE